MNNSENLIDKYGSQIAAFAERRITEIDIEIDMLVSHLKKEKEDLTQLLLDITGGAPISKNSSGDKTARQDYKYPNSKALIDKAIFVLRRSENLTINEIAEKIAEYEPKLVLKKTKGALSAVFAMDSKRGQPRLNRSKNEANIWIYNI